jgi:hypothetical protein
VSTPTGTPNPKLSLRFTLPHKTTLASVAELIGDIIGGIWEIYAPDAEMLPKLVSGIFTAMSKSAWLKMNGKMGKLRGFVLTANLLATGTDTSNDGRIKVEILADDKVVWQN